jgi:hypothetical protein
MLGDSYGQLEPYTLISGKEREVAVRGSRSDDLDLAFGLQRSEGTDDVPIDRMKQLTQTFR